MKKKLLLVIMACFLICFSNVFISLADSGWDYDYDSGSSWDYDSGSSWDYDSSWDWDYDYGPDYDSGSSSGRGDGWGLYDTILVFCFLGIPIIVIIYADHKGKARYSKRKVRSIDLHMQKKSKSSEQEMIEYRKHLKNLNLHTEDYYDEISDYPGFDKEKFLREAYNIYVGVQLAWSEFDYEKLRTLTTDELYNMYKMQLETLKIKNEKNVMRDFHKKHIEVKNIRETNGVLTVTVILSVTQRDYIVSTINNKVTRGDKNRICDVTYSLTFVSNVNKEVLNDCPNCGAPISNTASQKCEYCNSELVGNYNNDTWVLAKKQNIAQRR